MNERVIWIVRIIGIAVILLLLFLLMSLYSKLVRLDQERQGAPRPKSNTGRLGAPSPGAAGERGAHA